MVHKDPTPPSTPPSEEERIRLFSAFRKVASALELSRAEQAKLLGVSKSTVARWKVVPPSNPDRLDQMAMFVRMFDLAAQASAGEHGASEWFHRVNHGPVFGGRTPLACLLEGRTETFIRILEHLEAVVRIW